ncbi:N-terminal EF-hand calcium-binding protein 2 [Larimichthys crocea]|uniref:Uncharacterized protein n=1 Tax=Larimichthys crocea TaxID=215358 RepID=A0ACD3QFG7_LARCR|nr:N-terminal EF-hand calcium-binding protein 2 [Larimichthys crocea]
MKKSGEGRTDEGGGENERRFILSESPSSSTLSSKFGQSWLQKLSMATAVLPKSSNLLSPDLSPLLGRGVRREQMYGGRVNGVVSLLLIRQEMVVSQKKLGEFCEALKQYLKNVSTQRDCFHVTAVRLPDGLSFVVYEFWDGEEEWKRNEYKRKIFCTDGRERPGARLTL